MLAKRTLLIAVGVVLCAAIGFAALRSLARSFERSVMVTKSVRELIGIVKSKGYRKFARDNATRVENNQYFYTNDPVPPVVFPVHTMQTALKEQTHE